MAFTARIVFTDLCALVRPSPQELYVLLVDARSPTPEQKAAGMQRHKPLLGVPTKNLSLDPANRRADRLVPELRGDTLSLFKISREELVLSTPSLLDIVSYPLPLIAPRSRLEEETLDWIAALRPLGFTTATLHPAALGNLAVGPVASRVKISGGRVTCKRIIRDGNRCRQFDLKKEPGAPSIGARRALGDLIQVELTMPSVEENKGPQIISSSGAGIYILPSLDDSPVDLLIENMALDPRPISGDAAPHFRWFYELLKTPPPLLERTIPFAASPGLFTSASGAICPMGFAQ